MQLISPLRAAQAFGVSESSLKRWCDDGLIPMVRTAGGHRKLATPDLLRFAREQKRPLVAPAVLGLPVVREGAAVGLQRARPQFTESLLSGDESRALQIVLDLFVAGHSSAVICDELIAGAFREIGERWSCREAEVYQERRGCEIVVRILYELRRLLPKPSSSRTAFCATLSGDHYLLPPAMAETVLLAAGFATTSLGHDIPLPSLISAVERLHPDVLCLGISSVVDEREFVTGFTLLAKACEVNRTALVVGGRALNENLRTQLTYAAYCNTMQQLGALAGVLIGKRRRTAKSGARPTTSSLSPLRKRRLRD